MASYRFGPFLLDPARRQLTQDGVAVELPPKAFDVIVYLIEHRERAVGRDELISGVWGRVDVSDNVLDQIILRARKSLGDTTDPRRYLATRPRFGFAWVAEVEIVADAAPESRVASPAPEPSTPAAAAPRRLRTGRALALVSLLVVSAAVVGAWWLWPGAPAVATETGTVLVLPFEAPAEAGWTRLGLMDFVAQRLRGAGVGTLPSESTLALFRSQAQPDTDDVAAWTELGRRTGVDQIVSGKVQFTAGSWHVSLRTRARSGDMTGFSGSGHDPLDAARVAADALASALGHGPPGTAMVADAALALTLQQIDAAVLADEVAHAEDLLDALAPALQDAPAVQVRRASLLFRRGDLSAADDAFRRLLQQVPADEEPQLRASVLNALGNLALRRREPVETERRAGEAMAALSELPPTPELGRAWMGRAIARSTQGQYAEALSDFAQARVVLAAVGDRLAMARIDANVGIMEASRGRFAEAIPALSAATDRLAVFGELNTELFGRVALAQSRLAVLDPLAAATDERRLKELVSREPGSERRRYANLTRAQILWRNGRIREADELLLAIRRNAALEADVLVAGWAQGIAANWALAEDPRSAEREAQAALNAPWADESRRTYADTWLTLVKARARTAAAIPSAHDTAAAAAALAGFESWSAGTGPDPAVLPALWLARAELALARHDADVGTFFERGLEAAEATRVPIDWLQVAMRYVPWLIERGEFARAAMVAGRAEPWSATEFDAAMLLVQLHAALGHTDAVRTGLENATRLAGERLVLAPPELANN